MLACLKIFVARKNAENREVHPVRHTGFIVQWTFSLCSMYCMIIVCESHSLGQAVFYRVNLFFNRQLVSFVKI